MDSFIIIARKTLKLLSIAIGVMIAGGLFLWGINSIWGANASAEAASDLGNLFKIVSTIAFVAAIVELFKWAKRGFKPKKNI